VNESTDAVALLNLGDVADMTQGGDANGSEDKRREYA
jgi:hypothetical protein